MKKPANTVRVNPLILVLMVLLAGAIYFFLGVGFEISMIERLLMSLIVLVLFFVYSRKSTYAFWMFALTSITVFIALSVSFSSTYAGDSPIHLGIVLGARSLFLLALIIGIAATHLQNTMKSENRFAYLLLIVFVLDWLILSTNVKYFHDWMLENLLTVPFVILIFISHRWFRLSNISYGLMFVYMVLHTVGTHYTYSEVPFGDWLQQTLGLGRNHYDRVVHFAFGFLLAYPFREVVKRIGAARGFWGLYLPIEFVLAFSAIYEIIEWIIAIIFGGDLGVAYLGTQGDEWDAIKDMALAGLGAFITMIITAITILSYNARDFWAECRDSIHVRDKNPLGEHAIQEWIKKGK